MGIDILGGGADVTLGADVRKPSDPGMKLTGLLRIPDAAPSHRPEAEIRHVGMTSRPAKQLQRRRSLSVAVSAATRRTRKKTFNQF